MLTRGKISEPPAWVENPASVIAEKKLKLFWAYARSAEFFAFPYCHSGVFVEQGTQVFDIGIAEGFSRGFKRDIFRDDQVLDLLNLFLIDVIGEGGADVMLKQGGQLSVTDAGTACYIFSPYSFCNVVSNIQAGFSAVFVLIG